MFVCSRFRRKVSHSPVSEALQNPPTPDATDWPRPLIEHLEDLRWVLIKSCVAVAVGMVVCLIGADIIILALKWPLEKADRRRRQGVRPAPLLGGRGACRQCGQDQGWDNATDSHPRISSIRLSRGLYRPGHGASSALIVLVLVPVVVLDLHGFRQRRVEDENEDD